jgi:hypothetical protein
LSLFLIDGQLKNLLTITFTMKFGIRNNSIGETEFPINLQKWITDYDQNLALSFYIDLREEMPGEEFGYIECLINRTENLSLLKCFKSCYAENEGYAGTVIRDINNIFTSEENIHFKTFEGMKEGWSFHKYNLITMNKAISVIEYVVGNFSYPDDVRFDGWWNLNK